MADYRHWLRVLVEDMTMNGLPCDLADVFAKWKMGLTEKYKRILFDLERVLQDADTPVRVVYRLERYALHFRWILEIDDFAMVIAPDF